MEKGAPHGYFSGTIDEFRDISEYPEYLVNVLVDAHQKYNGDEAPSDEQINAWRYAIAPLNKLFDYARLDGSQLIILEAALKNRKRIDVLLCGRDTKDIDNAVILELKRWHWKRQAKEWNIRYHLRESEVSGMIDVLFEQHGEKSLWTKQQPILQVNEYKTALSAERARMLPGQRLDISGCVYLHDCCWLTEQWRSLLIGPIDNKISNSIPIYAQRVKHKQENEPERDVKDLASRLSQKIGSGCLSTFEKVKFLLNDKMPIIEPVHVAEEVREEHQSETVVVPESEVFLELKNIVPAESEEFIPQSPAAIAVPLKVPDAEPAESAIPNVREADAGEKATFLQQIGQSITGWWGRMRFWG